MANKHTNHLMSVVCYFSIGQSLEKMKCNGYVVGLSRYQNFSIRYQYQWKSTVLGTNFGTKAKHKNMLIKKHIFIDKVKQK